MYTVDILMITYRRPEYTRVALTRLLETSDENHRIWVWHNGDDKETLKIISELKDHPRFFRFHHSKENQRLTVPTNWFWDNADGDYLGKVDNDGYVSEGWIEKLCAIHEMDSNIGILGSWHFHEDDFNYELAKKKMFKFNDTNSIIENCWVSGNGYIMKRECQKDIGHVSSDTSFTKYCLLASKNGWRVGWPYPLVRLESMDDPRSEYTILKTDEDIKENIPLSAQINGVDTIDKWLSQLKRSAIVVLTATPDYRYYFGIRKIVRSMPMRFKKMIGKKQLW